MKINLEELAKNPASLTKEVIEWVLEPHRQGRELFNNACVAFEDDMNSKISTVDNRRKELTVQLDEADRKIEEITAKLPAASIAGDKEFKLLEDALDAIETERVRLRNRISQLDKVKPSGDERLYLNTREASSKLEKARIETKTSLGEIRMIVNQWVKYYKDIGEEIDNATQRVGGADGERLTKITKRYHSAFYAAYEAEQLALKQSKAPKQNTTVLDSWNPNRNRAPEPPIVSDHEPKKTSTVLCGWGNK